MVWCKKQCTLTATVAQPIPTDAYHFRGLWLTTSSSYQAKAELVSKLVACTGCLRWHLAVSRAFAAIQNSAMIMLCYLRFVQSATALEGVDLIPSINSRRSKFQSLQLRGTCCK